MYNQKKIALHDNSLNLFPSLTLTLFVNNKLFVSNSKKTVAEKIIYDAIDKIKSKSKDEPITIFNEAINNIRPTVEVRSRRVGGATYQVPVEVKSKLPTGV